MNSPGRRVPAVPLGHLVPIFAVLLEVLWSYPWLIWTSTWQAVSWPRPPLSLGSALVLAMGGEVMTRFALGRNWSLGQVRWLVLPSVVVLLALVVRLEQGGGYALWDPGWAEYALGHFSALVGGLAFGVYLVWRGISLGRESLPFSGLYPRFIAGLVALVLLLVLWGTISGSAALRDVMTTAGLYVLGYFVVGLVALALVNLQAAQEQMRRHQEAPAAFYRQWLPIVAGLVVAIVAASLVLASLFSFDLVSLLLHPLGRLADGLFFVFTYAVLYPLGLVVAVLIYIFRFLLRLLASGEPPQPLDLPDLSNLRRASEGQQAGGIPPGVVLALKWGLFALLVSLVLFLLARALFRYWKGKVEEGIEEVSESLWSGEAFKGDLRSLLAWLVRQLRWQRHPAPVAASPPMSVTGGNLPHRLFDVRELYRGLLWEGRRAGLPRQPAETPYEYEGKLEERVGTGAPQVAAITEAYVAERYGDTAVPGGRLVQLNDLWRQLLTILRKGEGQPRDGAG